MELWYLNRLYALWSNQLVAQHKLIFEAKNRQRIGVRQRFFLNVTGPATTNITSNTAPSPMDYSAQRLVWDNDSGKTHFVLDDPVTDNGTLEDHCASPAFECLEFSLTVADDGNWDNVSAALSLDNLSGTSMIGPSSVQIMSRDQGDPEKGLFMDYQEFYNTTSGSIVNFSDGFWYCSTRYSSWYFVVTWSVMKTGPSETRGHVLPSSATLHSDWAAEETTGGVTSQIQGNISPATSGMIISPDWGRSSGLILGKYIVNTQGHILELVVRTSALTAGTI